MKTDFLQSDLWRKFQENVGRKTHLIQNEDFSASIIEHILPMVGKYFYVPRGPIFSRITNHESRVKEGMQEIIELVKKENTGWIRIEPHDQEALEFIKKNIEAKIVKAPHDMQPKEIFAIELMKTTENLLAEMKPKTRYNIGLAQKKGVKILTNNDEAETREYFEAFWKISQEMAQRQGITTHPKVYYQKMLETFPAETLKIYVAIYDGKIIAANLVVFFEKTAIYLHGASSNDYRNVMAPFLLQWQAILDAKVQGCQTYDFGGIKTEGDSNWSGITNFKLGFSTKTKPMVFPGSWDIIVNSRKYWMYRVMQCAKALMVRLKN